MLFSRAAVFDVTNAYNTYKHEDDVYIGLLFVLAWEAFIIGMGIRAWRKPFPRATDLVWRYAFIFFAVFGIVGLSLQLSGMVAYVDTCQRLLHGQAPVLPPANQPAGAIYMLVIGLVPLVAGIMLFAFGQWFTDVSVRFYQEKAAFEKKFWEIALGPFTFDRRTAAFYTYSLAIGLSLFGLLFTLIGIQGMSGHSP
jgi:hypothetical protein